ncbi:MAG: AAA family ATPase [Oscillospiraceae bacterium]|nr:AAA family ATPase [Oscillospiraceae bacterium]
MGKVVAIASGKGGTGKSTVAAFLARALAEQGRSTLVVEADFGLRGLDLVLGVSQQTVYDCTDVLEERCRLSEAVVPIGRMGLWLLAGGNSADYMPDMQRWVRFLQLCRRCYDFTIIDLPGGLGELVRQSAEVSDLVLAVVTPNQIAVRDCAQLSRVLQQRAPLQRLVINRVPKKLNGSIQDLDEVIDRTGIMLLGVLPDSEVIQTAAEDGKALAEGKEKTAFENLAARLCGQYRPLVIR